MSNILMVFLGGGIGSLTRYGISAFVKTKLTTMFPLATLFSNILSCVVLAIAIGFFSAKMEMNPTLKLLILVGFCGGFSTFSSFSFETVELIRSGNSMYAISNILINVVACTGIIFFLTKSASA